MDKPICSIYKYAAINSNTFRILVCNELYFASPENFNDPFDCNVVPVPLVTRRDIKRNIKKEFPNLSRQKYREAVKKYTRKAPEILSASLRNDLDKIRSRLIICCFSEINNSGLMYSHYSDKHTGICLEFKVTEDPFYETLLPVRYSKRIPTIRFFKTDLESMRDAQLLHKQSEWSYEKEWRIINVDEPAGFHKFPPHLLTGIIFGLKTSDPDKALIQELTKYRQWPVSFYRCEKANDTFTLRVVPL
jgi:hypothetical protein